MTGPVSPTRCSWLPRMRTERGADRQAQGQQTKEQGRSRCGWRCRGQESSGASVSPAVGELAPLVSLHVPRSAQPPGIAVLALHPLTQLPTLLSPDRPALRSPQPHSPSFVSGCILSFGGWGGNGMGHEEEECITEALGLSHGCF